MATRGWFVLFHRGRYYRIFVHHDSYFEGLGASIVREIKENPGVLDIWRKLLDLGIVHHFVLEPPSSTERLAEWNEAVVALPSSESGIISDWFRSVERDLYDDGTDMLSRGDGCFIEYIYLVDMDNNDFSALKAYDGVQPILVWTMEELRVLTEDDWVKAAQEKLAPTSYDAFLLPSSIDDPMKAGIEQQGLEMRECLSFSIKAAVYLSTVKQTDETVVLKIFFDIGRNDKFTTYHRPMALVEMLQEYPHPNIVKILRKTTFGAQPSLVLEKYDGDIGELDCTTKEGQRDYIVAIGQAAKAIAHLHKFGVVHYDVKPKNILYRRNKEGEITAAVCDFESACVPFVDRDDRWRALQWGPMKQAKERNDLRDEEEVSDDSETDQKVFSWESYERRHDRADRRRSISVRRADDPRWEVGWEPVWCTAYYRHPQHGSGSPWKLDSYSLAVMLEGAETDDGVVIQMVELLKKSFDFGTAIENLEKVGDVLSGLAILK
jgi:Protein kinase domain